MQMMPADQRALERLSAAEIAAWRKFLRAHATVLRHLETELLEAHSLPLASYDVLVQLVESPEHKLRMTELAEAVMLSRSGLTRLIDRLEREGLVEREACVSDARGLFAVLTPAGYERLRGASGTHLRGVSERVVSRLEAEDLAALERVMDKLLS